MLGDDVWYVCRSAGRWRARDGGGRVPIWCATRLTGC